MGASDKSFFKEERESGGRERKRGGERTRESSIFLAAAENSVTFRLFLVAAENFIFS
jgi:hypothetical protein